MANEDEICEEVSSLSLIGHTPHRQMEYLLFHLDF